MAKTKTKKEAVLEVLTVSLSNVVTALYKRISATFATKDELQAATGATPEPINTATSMWNNHLIR